MTSTARTKHSILKLLAFSLGATMVALVMLVGGWLLWIALRPPPEGFAPTIGEAAGFAGQPNGVVQYTVDARSREDWAYFSFSDGRAVNTSQESLDWDLAFLRTDNLTNGGETNSQGLGGAVDLGDIPLGEANPPADGYLTDETDDEGGLENPALNKWYSYNWTTHVITSKNHAYALRTAGGEVALLTFVSYYCSDGSSGCITFSYLYPVEP